MTTGLATDLWTKCALANTRVNHRLVVAPGDSAKSHSVPLKPWTIRRFILYGAEKGDKTFQASLTA